ncbi:hypothetical protein DEO72_LG9g1857 [Vigna unguiculata]|uniref:Uncharacterized protein n=1 Tax=Vigna unguiculata TaxID=3917 RepID=A0A4D6MZA7_VIGUN|nr:hypothetical protein DEO72_LG9g1857 [Vigna unguiculata]
MGHVPPGAKRLKHANTAAAAWRISPHCQAPNSPGPHCFRHNRLADSPSLPGGRNTRLHCFCRHRLAESFPFARRLLHHQPTGFSLSPDGPSSAARRRISTCAVLVLVRYSSHPTHRPTFNPLALLTQCKVCYIT